MTTENEDQSADLRRRYDHRSGRHGVFSGVQDGRQQPAVIGAVAGVAFLVSFYFLVMRARQQT